jgi:hypothetical protein
MSEYVYIAFAVTGLLSEPEDPSGSEMLGID